MNRNKTIKCVVWDLDNTLWQGILSEDQIVYPIEKAVKIVKTLDERGILQSIASRNEYHEAMKVLEDYKLKEYFIYPQIGWLPKSESIKIIAKSINIGLDTIAFIDDQPFEREEVGFSLPEVLCLGNDIYDNLLSMPEMNPRFITSESKERRKYYINDIKRNKSEETFIGAKEDFLASLKMNFSLFEVSEDDLKRAEELTIRTNQLNSTGFVYSYEELNKLRKSKDHMLLTASLEDKYGSYGTIGLSLIECKNSRWIIKLLLMSCRVISRGVGTIMLYSIINEALKRNVELFADFIETPNNRMMYLTFKLAGFRDIEANDKKTRLKYNLSINQKIPDYVNVISVWDTYSQR